MKIKIIAKNKVEENYSTNELTDLKTEIDSKSSNEINKYKAGAEYTNGKVKITRPVKLDNGSTFQRNYWVDLKDVQPTDTILDNKNNPTVNGNPNATSSKFLGTENNAINNNTFATSVTENGKNFLNDLLKTIGEEPIAETNIRNVADQIKKIGMINQKLEDKKINEEIAMQLKELKGKLKDDIAPFFVNAEKIHKIFPLIANKLAETNTDKDSNYPVENYIPTWLDTNIEMRRSAKINKNPQYNFSTNKLELNLDTYFNPEHYNNAIGHKIEENKPEIKKICVNFLKDRDFNFNVRGQNFISKAQDNIPMPIRCVFLKDIYPQCGYSEQIGYGWDYLDPHMGQYYENMEHTNILADGLQLFMKPSAFRVLLMLDIEYASFIIGILASNKKGE